MLNSEFDATPDNAALRPRADCRSLPFKPGAVLLDRYVTIVRLFRCHRTGWGVAAGRDATEVSGCRSSVSTRKGRRMSLKEKLDATRAASTARRPPEQRAIMERATDDLRASGILRKVAAVGQIATPFVAPNYDGRTVSSSELLARGPLVVSFFRGAW